MAAAAVTTTGARGFLPALEGLRAVAAVGVLTTHVAFHSAVADHSFLGRALGRFDLWVAVFFGLSGFLLWRSHALAAIDPTGSRTPPSLGRYWRSRLVRILPAYLLVVVAALLLLPHPGGAPGWKTWAANLGLAQIYVPLTLTDGLTHMWSLSVEMTFYLILPLIGVSLRWLRGPRARWRIPLLLTLGVLSGVWPWVVTLPGGLNEQTQLPALGSWFLVGMVLAELAAGPATVVHRWATHYRVHWALAAVVWLLAASPLAGPEGLIHPSPGEFLVRTSCGAAIGWLLLAPLVLTDRGHTAGVLTSEPMQAAGRWSYSIFLWHLIVLTFAFPALGLTMFSGQWSTAVLVWCATVMATLVVSAASFALIEEPCRLGLTRWEAKRAQESRRDATRRRTARDRPEGSGHAAAKVTVTAAAAKN